MKVVPLTLKQANAFVRKYHRHNSTVVGCKYSIGLNNDDGVLCGVAIAGRPVSRILDDGVTCEINRLCTDGTRNACSKLYSACIKVARAMGYKKIITYTLESENGASLKASGFTFCGLAGGLKWTGRRYAGRTQDVPHERKKRWEIVF